MRSQPTVGGTAIGLQQESRALWAALHLTPPPPPPPPLRAGGGALLLSFKKLGQRVLLEKQHVGGALKLRAQKFHREFVHLRERRRSALRISGRRGKQRGMSPGHKCKGLPNSKPTQGVAFARAYARNTDGWKDLEHSRSCRGRVTARTDPARTNAFTCAQSCIKLCHMAGDACHGTCVINLTST